MLTLNWVIENKSMVAGILTQPSRRKQFALQKKKVIGKGEEVVNMFIHLCYISVLNTNTFLKIFFLSKRFRDFKRKIFRKGDSMKIFGTFCCI